MLFGREYPNSLVSTFSIVLGWPTFSLFSSALILSAFSCFSFIRKALYSSCKCGFFSLLLLLLLLCMLEFKGAVSFKPSLPPANEYELIELLSFFLNPVFTSLGALMFVTVSIRCG